MIRDCIPFIVHPRDIKEHIRKDVFPLDITATILNMAGAITSLPGR